MCRKVWHRCCTGRVASCHVVTKKRILPMIRINDGSPKELIRTAPESEVYVRYYQWRYAELKKNVGIAISKAVPCMRNWRTGRRKPSGGSMESRRI